MKAVIVDLQTKKPDSAHRARLVKLLTEIASGFGPDMSLRAIQLARFHQPLLIPRKSQTARLPVCQSNSSSHLAICGYAACMSG